MPISARRISQVRSSLLAGYGVADLTGANLSGANLTNANFSGWENCAEFACGEPDPGANLTNANLSGADAARSELSIRHAHRREYQQSDSVRRAHRRPRPDGRRVAGRPRLRRQSDRRPSPIAPAADRRVDQHLAMDATAARCGWCSTPTPGTRRSPSRRAFP